MTAQTFCSRRKRRAQLTTLITSCLLTWGSQAVSAADTTEETLRNELAKRDAVINDLLKRVQELERRDGRASGSQAATEPRPRPSSGQRAQTAVPSAQERSTGPGAVDVDELAAERALERTLTAEGALLLPAKTFELQPFFSYARRTTDSPVILAPTDPRHRRPPRHPRPP